jgi:hypothetical protein
MADILRYCQDCGLDRLFEQLHGLAGACPDAPDGHCPEWTCVACGAVLIIGLSSMPTAGSVRTEPAVEFDRVA